MNTTRCRGILGFLFGHRFEPRYSYEKNANTASLTEIVEAVRNSTNSKIGVTKQDIKALRDIGLKHGTGIYIKDVCPICGAELVEIPCKERRLDADL